MAYVMLFNQICGNKMCYSLVHSTIADTGAEKVLSVVSDLLECAETDANLLKYCNRLQNMGVWL